jgi:putative endonuclease
MNEKIKGAIGEIEAARFLEENGYTIVARNYRSGAGEVDIIVADKEKLVFVEVKRWITMRMENLEYAINSTKQKRIIESSKQYIVENPEYADFHIRYDVVLVTGNDNQIFHIDNAFNEDEVKP